MLEINDVGPDDSDRDGLVDRSQSNDAYQVLSNGSTITIHDPNPRPPFDTQFTFSDESSNQWDASTAVAKADQTGFQLLLQGTASKAGEFQIWDLSPNGAILRSGPWTTRQNALDLGWEELFGDRIQPDGSITKAKSSTNEIPPPKKEAIQPEPPPEPETGSKINNTNNTELPSEESSVQPIQAPRSNEDPITGIPQSDATGLHPSQMTAADVDSLPRKQFKHFSATELADLSLDAITGINRQQIRTLSADDLSLFKRRQIRAINTDVMDGFRTRTLNNLSRRQIRSFSIEQIDELSSRQWRKANQFVSVFSGKQLVTNIQNNDVMVTDLEHAPEVLNPFTQHFDIPLKP